jgi:ribonuclease P protein component
MLDEISPISHTFKKYEKLSSEIIIKELFLKGNSFFSYPFKFFYLINQPILGHSQLLITVSKRSFKRAVHRNLIKRRIRESYRLNKHLLFHPSIDQPTHKVFAIVYVAKDILTFKEIETKLAPLLLRLGSVH